MSRAYPPAINPPPVLVVYSRRGGQTQSAHTIRRRSAYGFLFGTASLIALAAGAGGFMLSQHEAFGPSRLTLAAQEQAAMALDDARRAAVGVRQAEERANRIEASLADANAARVAALAEVAALSSRADTARRELASASAAASAAEAQATDLRTTIAVSRADTMRRFAQEAANMAQMSEAVASLRASLSSREAALNSAQLSLAASHAEVASLARDQRAKDNQIAQLRGDAENAEARFAAAIQERDVHARAQIAQARAAAPDVTARAEALQAELRLAERRLAGERQYSGEVVRWARQQRTLADRTSQSAALALAATREATTDSLRVLTGGATPLRPGGVAANNPAALADACGDFGRVLEATQSMPLAPPFRDALQFAAAGTPTPIERDTVIRASAAGTVTFAARANRQDGFTVEIDHGRGITTRYSRLSSIDVRQGTEVRAGAPLGQVAPSSRSSTNTYQIFVDGKPVSPADAMRRGAELRTTVQAADERLVEAMALFPQAPTSDPRR